MLFTISLLFIHVLWVAIIGPSYISPTHDILVQGETVLINKFIWSPHYILVNFPSIVWSHPICFWSISAATNVSGSYERILIHSMLYSSKVTRTLDIGIYVDCFGQLVTYNISLIWNTFKIDFGKCS